MTPYAAGVSVWENIEASGNKIEQGARENLYLDLNDLML